MTCCVGIRAGHQVWLGGDSACTNDDTIEVQRDPKVRKRGEIVVGTAGDGRWETVMHFGVEIPPIISDLDKWIAIDFLDAVRAYIKQTGEDMPDGEAIVGVRGRLYYVDSDLCSWKPLDPYGAIGSGSIAALSALDAGIRGTPKHRIKRALEIAEKRITSVRRPFRFIST